MLDLRSEIAEMFATLDGYERYENELEVRSAWLDQYQRDYNREYYRTTTKPRYRSDREFRSRHLDAMERYRDRTLGADRPRRRRHGSYGPPPITHGTYHGYTKRGCRCAACRSAMAAYMRRRRAHQRSAA